MSYIVIFCAISKACVVVSGLQILLWTKLYIFFVSKPLNILYDKWRPIQDFKVLEDIHSVNCSTGYCLHTFLDLINVFSLCLWHTDFLRLPKRHSSSLWSEAQVRPSCNQSQMVQPALALSLPPHYQFIHGSHSGLYTYSIPACEGLGNPALHENWSCDIGESCGIGKGQDYLSDTGAATICTPLLCTNQLFRKQIIPLPLPLALLPFKLLIGPLRLLGYPVRSWQSLYPHLLSHSFGSRQQLLCA